MNRFEIVVHLPTVGKSSGTYVTEELYADKAYIETYLNAWGKIHSELIRKELDAYFNQPRQT